MAAGFVTSRLVAAAAAILIAHAEPLAADELISIQLGPATFSVPSSWIDAGWRNAIRDNPADSILLVIPSESLPLFDETIDTSDIESVTILLQHDVLQQAQHAEFMALAGAKEIGIASPTDAAQAFDGIAFDTLYGGEAGSSGKSATVALYLVGLVPRKDQTLVVGAKLDSDAGTHGGRQYIIAAPLLSGGAEFQALVSLTGFRPLRTDDLTWIDVTGRILNAQVSF